MHTYGSGSLAVVGESRVLTHSLLVKRMDQDGSLMKRVRRQFRCSMLRMFALSIVVQVLCAIVLVNAPVNKELGHLPAGYVVICFLLQTLQVVVLVFVILSVMRKAWVMWPACLHSHWSWVAHHACVFSCSR